MKNIETNGKGRLEHKCMMWLIHKSHGMWIFPFNTGGLYMLF